MAYSDYDLLPKLFVLNGTVKTTGTSADLAAGEFGLYDKDSHAIVTAANAASHLNAYIAQGSYYPSDILGINHGGYKESIKSPAPAKGINPKNVKRWYKVLPQNAVNQTVRLYWDGAAASASPTFMCGKTYYTRLELKGEPILRFINRYLYKQFGVYTGCCDDNCSSECAPVAVDSAVVMLGLATKINEDPIFSKFVSASAFVKKATTTITTTSASASATVASATGVAVGQKVVAAGVPAGATVAALSGTTVTLSAAATATGSAVPVAFSASIDKTYVSSTDPAVKAAVVAGLEVSVIYSETVFSDCSFNQADYYNESFIEILASSVHKNGDVCAPGEDVNMNSSTGENFSVVTNFVTAGGSGEGVLREFIASQLQSGIFFSHDPRSREVSNNVALTAVSRADKYVRYYLIYSVGQSGNPSNALSHDQYILCFAVKSGTSASTFEALMLAWLQAGNASLSLETIA